MTKQSSSAPMSADDVFDAAVTIAREVIDERSLGSRLSEIQERAMHEHVPTHRDVFFEDIINGQRRAMDQAASEFVVSYLQRIAELETRARRDRIAIDALTESGKTSAAITAKLEAENKSLRDAAEKVFNLYDNALTVDMPVDAHIAMNELGRLLKGAS